MEKTRLSDEQIKAVDHFNARSAYWHEIYLDRRTYAGYTHQKQHRFVVDFIRNSPARRILDVGCGAGFTALELARLGYAVSALDIAPEMIRIAQEEAQRQNLTCDLRVGLAEQLPFPDHTYDAVIALGLLGNLEAPELALRQINRVLKPGGCLLATMPNTLALDILIAFPRSLPIVFGGTRLRKPLRLAGNWLRRIMGFEVKDAAALRFGQTMTCGQTTALLKRAGFDTARWRGLTFGPIMPFGIRLVPDAASIRASEKLAAWAAIIPLLNALGSVVVFEAYKR